MVYKMKRTCQSTRLRPMLFLCLICLWSFYDGVTSQDRQSSQDGLHNTTSQGKPSSHLNPSDEDLASLPKCQSTCNYPKSTPTFFTIPDQGPLQLHMVKCTITAHEGHFESCQMDMNTFLKSVEDDEVVNQYTVLTCTNHTRIVFTNQNDVIKTNIIGYLSIEGCIIHWTTIALYAEALDLRVLYLSNIPDLFEDDQQQFEAISQVNNAKHGLNILPPSLQNIGTFAYFHSNLNSIPRIFTEYLWPRMAEISFDSTGLTYLPTALQLSMPLLQGVELYHNKLQSPVAFFPWNQESLDLPRNLSRTPNGNHHYALSQGFKTPPHKYRRVLGLANNVINGLGNLEFNGHIQKIDLSHNNIEEFTANLFRSVMGLENLDLSHNQILALPNEGFMKLTNLICLNLENNNISQITVESLAGLENLQSLLLGKNKITSLDEELFYSLHSLIELDVSQNQLKYISDNAVYAESDILTTVDVSQNYLTHIPQWMMLVRNLQQINFSNNSVNFSTFMESLADLDPYHVTFNNRWSASQFSIIPKPVVSKQLNLQNNKFNSLEGAFVNDTKREIFTTILHFFNIDLSKNDISCDCHMFEMYLFLINQVDSGEVHNQFAHQNWECSFPQNVRGRPVVSVQASTFKCPKQFDVCPSECICFERAVDHVVEVDCSSKSFNNLPSNLPPNSKYLNMTHNNLKELVQPPSYISDLEVLDVSFNSIMLISKNFINSLHDKMNVSFNHNNLISLPQDIENVNIGSCTLGWNKWACDCYASWFKNWLVENRHAVRDLDQIVCHTGGTQGKEIIEVADSGFQCQVSRSVLVTQVLVGFIISVLALVVLGVVIYRYRRELKALRCGYLKWHPYERTADTDVNLDCEFSTQ